MTLVGTRDSDGIFFFDCGWYNEFERQEDCFLSFKPDVLQDQGSLLFVTYPENAPQVEKRQWLRSIEVNLLKSIVVNLLKLLTDSPSH